MAQRYYKPLVLNITRSNQSRTFIVHKGGQFTVGQSGSNDLILYGTEYPRKHSLFFQQDGAYVINIRPFISGEVTLDETTLHINDLLKHDVLPRKGDNFLLKLSPAKTGFVTVGDARIEFSFQYIERKTPKIEKSSVYSWTRTTAKDLGKDLLFKFIFLILFTLNALIIYGLKDYQVNITKKIDIERIPERLAKFIIKPPEEPRVNEMTSAGANLETNNSTDKSEKKSDQKTSGENNGNQSRTRGSRGGGNPAASSGLLGLIGGSGPSSKSSSIVDALVDKGLVADLESILGGGSNLKVSKNGNNKDAIDPLDQLIGTGGSGGIDNWLEDMEEDVPQVTLTKKAKVDLIQPSQVTGSAEALGYRSEQSIMNVVLSRQGRITYLYEKFLKRNPNLRGKISIEFTIAANGFVTEAKVIESTMNHPQLEKELLALVKRLTFDPIPSGSVTTIFPFQFSKLN